MDEMRKCGRHLVQYFCRCLWVGKKVSDDGSEGAMVKMRKKSTLIDCNNWRVITLLSIPRKNLNNDCHQVDIRCSGENAQEGIDRVQEKTGMLQPDLCST